MREGGEKKREFKGEVEREVETRGGEKVVKRATERLKMRHRGKEVKRDLWRERQRGNRKSGVKKMKRRDGKWDRQAEKKVENYR